MKHKKRKAVHVFLGIGTLGWIAIMVFCNLGYKGMQLFHLNKIGWDMTSFNIWGVFFVFMGSLAYLVFSFITKSNKWHKILGVIGAVFGLILFAIFMYQRFFGGGS